MITKITRNILRSEMFVELFIQQFFTPDEVEKFFYTYFNENTPEPIKKRGMEFTMGDSITSVKKIHRLLIQYIFELDYEYAQGGFVEYLYKDEVPEILRKLRHNIWSK